jgi:hypothetical protein
MAQPARANVIAASLLVIAIAFIAKPASALVPQANSSLQHQFKQDSPIIEVAARRGAAGTTPIRARRRAFGTSAPNLVRLEPAP